MAKAYILAASAALALVACGTSLAYSGEFDARVSSPPLLTQFDALPTGGEAQGAPPRTDDPALTSPGPRQQALPKASHDEFQRYFDRHYRAHLVLVAHLHREVQTQ